ncbi:roadblock/LC7 domain-containing protein [Actinoalloteichus caeruleus]
MGGDDIRPRAARKQATSKMSRPRSAEAQKLAWLVNNFVSLTPSVVHAAVVSVDGLPLTCSDGVPNEHAEQLAALSSGLVSLAHGSSRLFDLGSYDQTVIRNEHGFVLIMTVAENSCLTVLTTADCDMKVVAYQMTLLVENAGHVLTPQLRKELREAVVA